MISARLFILSCSLLLATSHLFADDPAPAPEIQHEKESYIIGYQVGLSMKNDGVTGQLRKAHSGIALCNRSSRLPRCPLKQFESRWGLSSRFWRTHPIWLVPDWGWWRLQRAPCLEWSIHDPLLLFPPYPLPYDLVSARVKILIVIHFNNKPLNFRIEGL